MGRLKLDKKDGITGTRDGICIYKMRGEYFIRSKSTLSGKRVKTSPAFKNTMLHAGILGRASKIASYVYRALPSAIREYSMYRSLTGDAMRFLKAGIKDEEVKELLSKQNVPNPQTARLPTLQHQN